MWSFYRLFTADQRIVLYTVGHLTNDKVREVVPRGVLGILIDPLAALHEARRVLQPGGLIGVRSADLTGDLLAPSSPALEKFFTLYEKLWRHKGGDPLMGRRQSGLLYQVGFSRVKGSASYENWSNTDNVRALAELMTRFVLESDFAHQVVKLGWVDFDTLQAISRAWREWGGTKAAFHARAWGEAVGWLD